MTSDRADDTAAAESAAPRQYVIAAMLEEIPEGTPIDRRDWPAHVTLVPSFSTSAPIAELASAIRRAHAGDAPLVVTFGERAMFGRDGDIPVRLVECDPACQLHRRIADEVQSIGGVVAAEPEYWLDGYQPHVTLGPRTSAAEGEQTCVQCIVIAHLDRDAATVVASHPVRTA